MTTDAEIIQLWKKSGGKAENSDAIIRFYRAAEEEGGKEAVAAMENELLSEATIEAAIKTFGFGRKSKAGIITQKAIMREAICIAKGKTAGRQD